VSLEIFPRSAYVFAMAILPILEAPDPRLRTISTPVEAIDDDLQRLIDDMFETMYDAPGIGGKPAAGQEADGVHQSGNPEGIG